MSRPAGYNWQEARYGSLTDSKVKLAELSPGDLFYYLIHLAEFMDQMIGVRVKMTLNESNEARQDYRLVKAEVLRRLHRLQNQNTARV